MGFFKHTTTFFGKMFYKFYFTLMKNIFSIILIFFFNIFFLFCQNMCFQTRIHFKLSVTKDFFLDVNLKTMFFEGQNKSMEMSSKKRILSDLASKILILLKNKRKM